MRLFVDNLTNIDFSYLCPERGLVGETWLAHIELSGALDQQGMICDFGIVKKHLRQWLDYELDHRLLIPSKNPQIDLTESDGRITVTLQQHGATMLQTAAPHQAMTIIDTQVITPESVAIWSIKQLRDSFGESVKHVDLVFTPESIDGPFYHYSHGLKKHEGNCQRITHGHRSAIQIWRNGRLCTATMQQWAKRWQDIYIATREDCHGEDGSDVEFAYRAEQGLFELRLPKSRCYFIDSDSTVEHIAQHIADTLSAQTPGDHIVVKAFEGVGKGAIAEAG